MAVTSTEAHLMSKAPAPPSHDELSSIFERLVAGESLPGWGHTQHNDFDTLFNNKGEQWQRGRLGDQWYSAGVFSESVFRPPNDPLH